MMNLDDEKIIKKLDRENMLAHLKSFPEQCRDAQHFGMPLSIPGKYTRTYSNIVFLGVGGSAIGADLIKDYLKDKGRLPISVCRDYDIPSFVGEDTLVFASSYSGNTEETLGSYREAQKRGASIIAITSGGMLKKKAEENNDILISIPEGYPPRCALGYSFIPALVSLSKFHIAPAVNAEIDEASILLEKLGKISLWPNVKGTKNMAKRIAKRIFSKFIVIYASDRMGVVATRWRGQIAENSKTLSSSHVYPEMNHNEIVGWRNPKHILKKFVVIQLRDDKDHMRVRKRMDITERILKKEEIEVINVKSRGEGLLSRILSLIYIGDFVSFYLAILNGIDPTPVEKVTYLKKELAKL